MTGYAINQGREVYTGADGLIHCAKCDGLRQVYVLMNGKRSLVNCICQCENELYESAQDKSRRHEKEKRIKAIKRQGFSEADYEHMTFANDDRRNPAVSDQCLKYAEQFGGSNGLLLLGEYGTGKSYLSACIANYLMEKEHTVLMTNLARLYTTVYESFDDRQKRLDNINRYDLLIIDDLGTERHSEAMMEFAFNVVDGRYKANKPIIVSTNHTYYEMLRCDDKDLARIYDRIVERCEPVQFSGGSRRKEAAIKNIAK